MFIKGDYKHTARNSFFKSLVVNIIYNFPPQGPKSQDEASKFRKSVVLVERRLHIFISE